MTNLGSIEARAIKHICLVGNRDAMVQGMMDTLILSCGRVSKDEMRTHMVRDAPTGPREARPDDKLRRAPHHEDQSSQREKKSGTDADRPTVPGGRGGPG